MLRRTIVRAFAVAATAALLSTTSTAKDYQCRQRNGCVAHKVVDGVLTPVNFKKGDLISTQDGWVVDPLLGWKKIKAGGQSSLAE